MGKKMPTEELLKSELRMPKTLRGTGRYLDHNALRMWRAAAKVEQAGIYDRIVPAEAVERFRLYGLADGEVFDDERVLQELKRLSFDTDDQTCAIFDDVHWSDEGLRFDFSFLPSLLLHCVKEV